MSKAGIRTRRPDSDEIAFEAFQRKCEDNPEFELSRRKHQAEEEARKNPDPNDWIRNQSQ